MTPVASIGTFASTLLVELSPGKFLELKGVHVKEMGSQLETLEWLCSNAAAVGSIAESLGEEPFENRTKRLRPILIRAHYGSPLVAVLGLPGLIAADVSAMGLLICGLKYLWGLDLELRSHREEQRTRFYEAQEKALRAKAKLDDLRRELDARISPLGQATIMVADESRDKSQLEELQQKFEALSRDLGWGPDTAFEMTKRKTSGWAGEEAFWSIDDH